MFEEDGIEDTTYSGHAQEQRAGAMMAQLDSKEIIKRIKTTLEGKSAFEDDKTKSKPLVSEKLKTSILNYLYNILNPNVFLSNTEEVDISNTMINVMDALTQEFTIRMTEIYCNPDTLLSTIETNINHALRRPKGGEERRTARAQQYDVTRRDISDQKNIPEEHLPAQRGGILSFLGKR